MPLSEFLAWLLLAGIAGLVCSITWTLGLVLAPYVLWPMLYPLRVIIHRGRWGYWTFSPKEL